ncbi:MAG TPA: hypothetical protein VGR09_09520 [Gemmatimonadales bacterium]|nr:hypothetical protein [Gemmatimonadales bacterium]
MRQAQAAIRKEIHRGLFLLTPRAIGILRAYVWQVETADPRTIDYPDLRASGLIQRTYDDFYDTAQRDLGVPGLWLVHRKAGYTALRDRLDHLWLPWTLQTFEGLVQYRRARRQIRRNQGGRLRGEPELTYRWHAALGAIERFLSGPRRPV